MLNYFTFNHTSYCTLTKLSFGILFSFLLPLMDALIGFEMLKCRICVCKNFILYIIKRKDAINMAFIPDISEICKRMAT